MEVEGFNSYCTIDLSIRETMDLLDKMESMNSAGEFDYENESSTMSILYRKLNLLYGGV